MSKRAIEGGDEIRIMYTDFVCTDPNYGTWDK